MAATISGCSTGRGHSFHRGLVALQIAQGDTAIVKRFRHVGLDGQRAVEDGHGFVGLVVGGNAMPKFIRALRSLGRIFHRIAQAIAGLGIAALL